MYFVIIFYFLGIRFRVKIQFIVSIEYPSHSLQQSIQMHKIHYLDTKFILNYGEKN